MYIPVQFIGNQKNQLCLLQNTNSSCLLQPFTLTYMLQWSKNWKHLQGSHRHTWRVGKSLLHGWQVSSVFVKIVVVVQRILRNYLSCCMYWLPEWWWTGWATKTSLDQVCFALNLMQIYFFLLSLPSVLVWLLIKLVYNKILKI